MRPPARRTPGGLGVLADHSDGHGSVTGHDLVDRRHDTLRRSTVYIADHLRCQPLALRAQLPDREHAVESAGELVEVPRAVVAPIRPCRG